MKHQNQSNKWNHAIQNTKCPAKLFIIYNSPVKTMTWILMEIPCHFSSQIDGSLVKIGTKFHDYSMSFIQVLFVFHAGTWHGFCTWPSHRISMAFAKKMMGFSSELVSFSTKLSSERHDKIPVIFFTGYVDRKGKSWYFL